VSESKPWTHYRAQHSALRQNGRTPDDPKVVDSLRNMKAAKLADYIAKVVNEAPVLTREQRDRLATILHGGAA
jgi:hypothetical protein